VNTDAGAESLSATTLRISRYLREIPGPEEDWLALTAPDEIASDQAVVMAIVGVLRPFNAIAIRRDGSSIQIRARSEAARLFLASLSAFLEADAFVVRDWQRKGIREERFGYQDLSQGVQLLYLLERLRLAYPGAQPIRNARVVKALVKAEVDGIPKYLVQYDAKTHGFQLIGGHVLNSDESDETAIKREISEELRQNIFEFGRSARVQRLGSVRAAEMSLTIGAFTEYEITYFQLFVDFPLQTQSSDTWVTAEQLAEGKTPDRAPILESALRLFYKDLTSDLAKLPIGAPRRRTPLTRHAFAIVDRHSGRIGVALGALGLLIPLLAFASKGCSTPHAVQREPAALEQSKQAAPATANTKSP